MLVCFVCLRPMIDALRVNVVQVFEEREGEDILSNYFG
jgi:hypothetical protein